MATGPWPYFLPTGYIRVSCGLYRPPAGILRWHRRANTRKLPACSKLSVGKLGLCAHLRASLGKIHVKYWQVRASCSGTVDGKNCPLNLLARLAWKGVTGALRNTLIIVLFQIELFFMQKGCTSCSKHKPGISSMKNDVLFVASKESRYQYQWERMAGCIKMYNWHQPINAKFRWASCSVHS